MLKHWAMAMFVAAAAFAAAGPAGEWKISQPGVTLICTFAIRGEALAGTCRPESGPEGVPITGTVHGRQIEWRFQIALDATSPKQEASYRATLARSASRMRGSFAIADRRGRFTGTKQ